MAIENGSKRFELSLDALIVVFFGLVLLIGLWIFRDYGVGWDEPRQHLEVGTLTYEYVFHGAQDLLADRHRFYGPLFEFILVAAGRLAGQVTFDEAVYTRHLLIFLSFFGSAIAFYFILRRMVTKPVCLLGAAFFFLSPRIFADAFYNSKDIPFLACYTLCLLTLLRAIETFSWKRLLVHALTTGALIAIRMPGLIMIVISLFGFALGYIAIDKRDTKFWIKAATFPVISFICVMIFWPWLWSNPVSNLIEAYKQMVHFPWPRGMLYMGHDVYGYNVPWHYALVWIIISTPPIYQYLFLFGLTVMVGHLLTRKTSIKTEWQVLLCAAACILPILIVVILHSTLYDGWRHIYFTYPPFLIVATYGANKLWQTSSHNRAIYLANRGILVVALTSSMLLTLRFMIVNHPYQNVYFNYLLGKQPQDYFDLDYWGVSYSKLLRFVVADSSSDRIAIYGETPPALFNSCTLNDKDKARLAFVGHIEDASYMVTTFRFRNDTPPGFEEKYSILVEGNKIGAVFKRIGG